MNNYIYIATQVVFIFLAIFPITAHAEKLIINKQYTENTIAMAFASKNIDMLKAKLGNKYGGVWTEYEDNIAHTILALTDHIDIDETIMRMSNMKIVYVTHSHDELESTKRHIESSITATKFKEIYSIYINVKNNKVMISCNPVNIENIRLWISENNINYDLISIEGRLNSFNPFHPSDKITY